MGKMSFSSRNGNLWTSIGAVAGAVAGLALVPLTAGLSAFTLPHTLLGGAALAGAGVAGGALGHQLDRAAYPKSEGDGGGKLADEEHNDDSDTNGGADDPRNEGESSGIGQGIATGNGTHQGVDQTGVFAGVGAKSFGFTRPEDSSGSALSGAQQPRKTAALGAGAAGTSTTLG